MLYQGLVEFLNQRGLANASIACHQHAGRPALAGLLKSMQELIKLLFPTVEMLRDDEAVRYILLAKRKRSNFPYTCPLLRTALEICPQSERALIPLFGGL